MSYLESRLCLVISYSRHTLRGAMGLAGRRPWGLSYKKLQFNFNIAGAANGSDQYALRACIFDLNHISNGTIR